MQYGAVFPDGVSKYLKVYITSGEDSVTGYLTDGGSAELTANWMSAFEGDSLGSVAGESLSNATQAVTNTTSISRFNSLLVWNGSTPMTFNLPVYFQATADANLEVNAAIMALSAMASPELGDFTPMGRRPLPAILDIGRRIKIFDVVIQNVTYELDAPKTSDGFFTHNTVNLQITAMAVTNRSEMATLFI